MWYKPRSHVIGIILSCSIVLNLYNSATSIIIQCIPCPVKISGGIICENSKSDCNSSKSTSDIPATTTTTTIPSDTSRHLNIKHTIFSVIKTNTKTIPTSTSCGDCGNSHKANSAVNINSSTNQTDPDVLPASCSSVNICDDILKAFNPSDCKNGNRTRNPCPLPKGKIPPGCIELFLGKLTTIVFQSTEQNFSHWLTQNSNLWLISIINPGQNYISATSYLQPVRGSPVSTFLSILCIWQN